MRHLAPERAKRTKTTSNDNPVFRGMLRENKSFRVV